MEVTNVLKIPIFTIFNKGERKYWIIEIGKIHTSPNKMDNNIYEIFIWKRNKQNIENIINGKNENNTYIYVFRIH